FKENYQKLGNVAGFNKGSELPDEQPILPGSISAFHKVVNHYGENGEIGNQKAVHKLILHLTAVGHFVDHGSTEKAIKHLKNIKPLINHYQDNDAIEKDTAMKLKKQADHLINK